MAQMILVKGTVWWVPVLYAVHISLSVLAMWWFAYYECVELIREKWQLWRTEMKAPHSIVDREFS